MSDYSAGNIRVLEGLDAVRLRPGMYIGTTGVKGLHHILWEIVDNSIDEVSNGFATGVTVTIHADGSASVEDDGRGIPVDIHPKLGVSGVEVVFTQLHAGGKFDSSNYAHSGGLHGVGASVTNALSEWLKVEVFKNGTTYRMEFESRTVNGEVKGGLPKYSLIDTGEKTDKHGSYVRFLPDKRIFETVIFQFETIARRLKELAFLNKGLRVKLIDERVRVGEGYRSLEYCYDGGIVDFVKYINEARNTLYDEPITVSGERDGIAMEVAFQHTDAYTENLFSYVNNIPTTEGGTHETGFKAAYTKVMNDFARRVGMLKEKDANLLGDDYREGLTAVLSVQMTNVQFEGQTKTKLGNPAARIAIEGLTSQLLGDYFADPKNAAVGEAILKKGLLAAKVREAARKEKEITRAKNAIDNFNLVGKLTPCTGKKPENNELFIVEGDSAGGTCKQARARSYQAILPLRGKPLNAEKKRIDQVLANEEIRTLISALGSGIGEDFNVDNLNYHKVIILSDADVDGYHIRAILLTFFFRYMKDLINEGHVYIGLPPLYKIEKGNQVEYAYDDDALAEAKSRFGKGAQVQRYKGLGEMNADQLWETTMDPKNRALMQVSIEDAAEAEKLVSVLMGDAVELRREYIIEHADFNKVDSFNPNK
ncbi:MAG: type IIA DNA topoisomerase subunit B [Clostridiales bacterium]|uniref:DNA gyrase/topoisomerase IV subunit B n=1 Tax=Anaerocaecibacter muris TaxID=2941513 RepID=UPI00203C81E6|nr:DNA topoisomerase subunit B [Anaerocaecibacter muris]MDE6965998.1 type IIA DNA topoisomerase subunit B [Clostridiales bacterium]